MSDLVSQALAALRQKNFAAARDLIAAYAEDNALDMQHYLIKGLSEFALQDWASSEATFADATEVFPHQAQLWLNRGAAEENLGHLDAAVQSYERCLNLNPKQADACGNLSNIYRRQGRFIAAEDMAHRAFELGAPKAQALNSLGLAVAKQGKFDAAEKIFKEALEAEPANAQILANLANLAVDQLKFDAAWPLFASARAVSNAPVIRRDEGLARLLAGDYMQGWPLHEARLELPTALRVRPTCPRWNGESVVGKKILLVAEQGFGDVIQFCRYGWALADRGAQLIWVVRKPLQRLLAANVPDAVITEDDPIPATDCWLPLMSLPLALLRFQPSDAPGAPYLRASESGPRLPGSGAGSLDKKIGLVWSGSPTHERDHERSVPLEMFTTLFQKYPVHYYAPFSGAGLEQITGKMPVTRLDKLITDFADTASLLMQLDLVISVDTSVAHLAGALGIKTFLLLPYCPDWRWGISGATTPWYASMTLVRQPAYGDWDAVFEQLSALLI